MEKNEQKDLEDKKKSFTPRGEQPRTVKPTAQVKVAVAPAQD